MQDLYIKPQREYLKGEKALLYIMTALVFSFVVFMSFHQDKMRETTLISGRKMRVAIIAVDCHPGRGKSKLYFKSERKGVKSVYLPSFQCNMYLRGDTITVFANDRNDWFEIDPACIEDKMVHPN